MLTLLQGYYHFLLLGKFLEQLLLTNDLSDLSCNLPIKTGENSSFLIRESLVKSLFISIYEHPKKRNVYGYLTEISAFKGIFSVMREAIETDPAIKEFIQSQLQDQYFAFEQVVRFLRNVLNHATTSHLYLKEEDYQIQKEFILSSKVQRTQKLKGSAHIQLDFVYAKYRSHWQGGENYGVEIHIDFAKLVPGQALEEIVCWHELYLLSELCFNLAQVYDHHKKQVKKQTLTSIQKSSQSSKKVQSPKSSLSKKTNKKSLSSKKHTTVSKSSSAESKNTKSAKNAHTSQSFKNSQLSKSIPQKKSATSQSKKSLSVSPRTSQKKTSSHAAKKNKKN